LEVFLFFFDVSSIHHPPPSCRLSVNRLSGLINLVFNISCFRLQLDGQCHSRRGSKVKTGLEAELSWLEKMSLLYF